MKPSKKPADNPQKKSPKKIRNYLLAAGVVAAVVIVAAIFLTFQPSSPKESPKDEATRFQEAGALYTKSVDLANEGKNLTDQGKIQEAQESFQEALQDADEALALNATSLKALIQTQRSGVLVALGRYTDANAAADDALGMGGNLNTTFSIAWYNKGNALRALGNISEAEAAYAKAYELDKTLVPPDMSSDSTSSVHS
ncbi:MAG: tetratricopeptide repeat protein [Methanoregula sp.]|jgi:tetratricopeptide (TPR) repeat protein|uniref:tetratricopeptide repeat protein n=1 Tax=Methanoregula sp. TaxID=2052170 RepID=UPI003D11555D